MASGKPDDVFAVAQQVERRTSDDEATLLDDALQRYRTGVVGIELRAFAELSAQFLPMLLAERKRDADDRTAVSSVRVSARGRHVTIEVWNRGAHAGTLVVLAEDWESFVRLFGFAPDSITMERANG